MRLFRQLPASAALLASTAALAHEGHGLDGPLHWHATDAVGFAAVVVLAALAYWFSRDK